MYPRTDLYHQGIPDEVGVLLGCALPTGAGMVLNYPDLSENGVAVVGLGGVGMSALMTLIALSSFIVVAIDSDDERQASKDLGADL